MHGGRLSDPSRFAGALAFAAFWLTVGFPEVAPAQQSPEHSRPVVGPLRADRGDMAGMAKPSPSDDWVGGMGHEEATVPGGANTLLRPWDGTPALLPTHLIVPDLPLLLAAFTADVADMGVGVVIGRDVEVVDVGDFGKHVSMLAVAPDLGDVEEGPLFRNRDLILVATSSGIHTLISTDTALSLQGNQFTLQITTRLDQAIDTLSPVRTGMGGVSVQRTARLALADLDVFLELARALGGV